MTTFEPLDHTPRAINVANVLRRAIMSGSLLPGSPLREAQIAADMNVSRAPLREALRTLEEEGLVTRIPYRGAFVASVGPEVIEEVASLRVRLEPYAAELSLPYFQKAGFGELHKAADDIEARSKAGDLPGMIDAHLGMHRLFYLRSNHSLLMNCWRSWEAQLRLYLAIDHSSFTSHDVVILAHRRLLSLYEQADMTKFAEELRTHVEVSAHAVSQAQSED
ncbi:GntR family transcriptional regulator [Saccharopolyspora sp. ASAGF58]|uniref:GntR family transcriptional regulator n=1 Tax=Saccharopolyspora sp. ASAGF58 TaxID=2719023 RepID=UPI00143FD7E5|nr:GntR family transcriptional regulator [Saccharopolyspora sp. ASAGF58]QIZ37799.1 GntR family transcriptional regulator [Saccharopolyspora sp. ASAGF58]